MKTEPPASEWLETQARVTGCKYQFARMNTLTLGVSSDTNQFLVTFTYYVHDKIYTDQFTSPSYHARDEMFLLFYNPLAPHQNTKSGASAAARTPVVAIGVAGSILLSALYLASLHGCS